MTTAAARFADFIRAVQAFAERLPPSSDSVQREAGMDDLERFDQISRGVTDMLLHLGQVARDVNDLTFVGWAILADDRAIWDATDQYRDAFRAILKLLRTRAWTWHQRIRTVLPPELERVRGRVFGTSWHACLSAALLAESLETNIADRGVRTTRTPLALGQRVHENGFVRHLLAAQRTSFIVSTEPVANYSIGDWKCTLDGLWAAIFRHGLTPSGARLLEALVYRYAMWLVHDEDEYRDWTALDYRRVFDHWTFCRDPPAPALPVVDDDDPLVGPLQQDAAELSPMLREEDLPLNPRLRLGFLIHSEKQLNFAMRHMQAARACLGHERARPLVFTEDWRRRAVRALVDMAGSILRDTFMKTDAIEAIKNLIVRRHLTPGEAERALFESGSLFGLEVEADNVLYDMRRAEGQRLQNDVLPLAVHEHLAEWANHMQHVVALSFRNADDEWDRIAAARPINERTAFLVIESAIDSLLRRFQIAPSHCSLRSYGYADDAGLVPPFDCPPASPEVACNAITASGGAPQTPLFIALAHVYVVVLPDISEPRGIVVQRVLFTPHLPDALCAWLALCLARKRFPASIAHFTPILPVLRDAQMAPHWS
jgi:hypothetical protein